MPGGTLTCFFRGQQKIYSFFFQYKLLHDLAESLTKTLTQNRKTGLGREKRGRGVSQRRAIKIVRSGVLCVYVCAVLKKRYHYTSEGPQQQELGHSWVGGLGLI